MKSFSPGDIVKRIGPSAGRIEKDGLYTIKCDVGNPSGSSCIELEGHDGFHFDREYFELVTNISEDTVDDEDPIADLINNSPFNVGDIVVRNTDKYSDSFMKKGKAYKITQIITKDVLRFEGSHEGYTAKYFNRIKFKFNVGDFVKRDKFGIDKSGKVHSMSQNGSYFYFANADGSKGMYKYKVSDFELVSDNHQIAVPIRSGDCLKRIGPDHLEVKEGYSYLVHKVYPDGAFCLMIDGRSSTFVYSSEGFLNLSEQGSVYSGSKLSIGVDFDSGSFTVCPPTMKGIMEDVKLSKNFFNVCPKTIEDINLSYPIGAVGAIDPVGDSIYSNPIIPMKTFNEYAVEAFMSNEDNRTAATNARTVLSNLIEGLDLAVSAIDKVKRVINNDYRRLNSAMEDSQIETISAIIAENPAVKEFVERFMENTLVELLPDPVVTSNSVADKFK